MPDREAEQLLLKLLESIQLPEGAYETAVKRYQNLGEWFHRPGSTCAESEPEIFSQGSFRLGTATNGEHYDLDLGCRLRKGITKANTTQKAMKELIGGELELYRSAHGIKERLEEKRRCWRMIYADGFSFHMDIVPCIPEEDPKRTVLKNRMLQESGFDDALASEVSELAVSITDNEDAQYTNITPEWRISNPQGYARWFEARMRLGRAFLEKRASDIGANIEDVPVFRWQSPLQGAVQLLKHHRDEMFSPDDDSRPISVIITTLAARAYSGETTVADAIEGILNSMERHVNPRAPRVPNPVNPAEDFADKWSSGEPADQGLEESFRRWLIQARADFSTIIQHRDVDLVFEAADRGFGIHLDKRLIERTLGLAPAVASGPRTIKDSAPRPWHR